MGKDQKNPEDATFVHEFLKNKISLEDKILNGLFVSLTKTDKSILPNIIFDKTFKDLGDLNRIVPRLLQAGYKKENMHLVWVLTDYRIALQQNLTRDRTVPVTILIQAHTGVAKTMTTLLTDSYPYNMINGDAFVVLGGQDNTVFFKPPVDSPKKRKMVAGGAEIPVPRIVKHFEYIKVKDSGTKIKNDTALTRSVMFWILKNSPDKEIIKNYLDSETQ